MGLTLRTVEARPNRKAENGSGVIGKGAASLLEEICMGALPVSSSGGVQGRAPENLDF